MSRRDLFAIAIGLSLLLTACAPAAQPTIEQPLPTLASLDVPPPLEGAERVARDFLFAWQNNDFAAMYALTTFASQEATPLESFTGIYQAAQNEMTLVSLSATAITMVREPNNVILFHYSLTFTTRLLGEFTDPNRNLRLVFDSRANDWRIAWSPADIFADMGGGARLRLEISAPSRANIYDRDGLILADQNGRFVNVSAIKRDIPNWEACLPVLAPILRKEPSDVQRIYDESSPDWLMALGTIEPAAYDQSHTTLEQLCAAQFTSPVRRYLDGTLAPHILGNVGYPDAASIPAVETAGFTRDTILGRSGIEASWDATLRGSPGARLLIVSQGGDIVREVMRSPSHPAESVWLTLDADLQTAVTRILSSAYANAKDGWATTSRGAAAIVMDVRTGEILAMVSYPTYDGNAFNPFPVIGRDPANSLVAQIQADPRRPQLNRVTQGVYPLGSVMKTVSVVAVTDSGIYALDRRFTCTGVWRRDITRYDWLAGGHGTVTPPTAITQSCNPFFYEVGYELNQFDPYALPTYARRAGFGGPTGLLDLTESPGLIIDPDWKRVNTGLAWTFSDAVNMSIGQGELQVTPLQVARWFAAIANGGTLYRPLLVKQVGILGEAPSFVAAPDPLSTVGFQPAVMDMLRQGLCDVTSARSGTAEYQFRSYRDLQRLGVCGKTGTAQDGSRPDAVSHAWFAAYAPRENPQIAVVVLVENSGEGSGVAAPIARDILNYYFFERP